MNEPPEWEPMWYERDVRRTLCVFIGAAGGIALGGYAGYAITAANPYNSLDAVGASAILGGLLGMIIGSLAGLLIGGARPAVWERWHGRQKVAATFGVLTAMVAVAVLGGFGLAQIGHGSKAAEKRTNDKAHVATLLEGFYFSGADFSETQSFVRVLKRARSDGVSRAWTDKELSDAENAISQAGGCNRCITILEHAR